MLVSIDIYIYYIEILNLKSIIDRVDSQNYNYECMLNNLLKLKKTNDFKQKS